MLYEDLEPTCEICKGTGLHRQDRILCDDCLDALMDVEEDEE